LGRAYQKTTFWTKIGGGLGQGSILKKFGNPYVFLQPLKLAASNLVHNFGLVLAYQKQRLGQKLAGVWAKGASKQNLGPLRISATVEASNFKFGTQLGFGRAYQKNNVLDQNWQGSGPGEHPKKIWDPLLILQPLKLATSNLVHNFGLVLAYQKQRLGQKLAGVWAKGASKQNLRPLRISATVEASNFKCGAQIGFGTSLAKNNI